MPSPNTITRDRSTLASWSRRLPANHPKLTELRTKIKTQMVQRSIEEALESKPTLTPDQRRHLAAILLDGATE